MDYIIISLHWHCTHLDGSGNNQAASLRLPVDRVQSITSLSPSTTTIEKQTKQRVIFVRSAAISLHVCQLSH